MKHLNMLAGLLGLATSLFACSPISGKSNGMGGIYSDVAFHERATDNALGGKRGEACASNILGVVATGDASAATAA